MLDVKALLTKITDWIGDKSYTGYGTGVNITSYNSSGNMYTVPSDGIIIVNGNYRSGSYAILYNQNGDTIAEASAGGSANSAGNTLIPVPVYKGMKYYGKVSSGYSYIWYYPYV